MTDYERQQLSYRATLWQVAKQHLDAGLEFGYSPLIPNSPEYFEALRQIHLALLDRKLDR